MTIKLDTNEKANNETRQAKGWERYIKVQCKCGTRSPLGTADELRSGYWEIRKNRHTCPLCLKKKMANCN